MSTFISTNPANTSDVVAEVPAASVIDIVDALRRAKSAQKAWAKLPAPARGRIIANVGRLFENNKEALSRLVTREMGKVYAEALGEVQEVIDTCDFFLGEGRRLYGMTVPSEMPNKNLFTFRQPVGTALIITAGNTTSQTGLLYDACITHRCSPDGRSECLDSNAAAGALPAHVRQLWRRTQ